MCCITLTPLGYTKQYTLRTALQDKNNWILTKGFLKSHQTKHSCSHNIWHCFFFMLLQKIASSNVWLTNTSYFCYGFQNMKKVYWDGKYSQHCLLGSMRERGNCKTKSLSFFRPYISVYAVQGLLPWLSLLPSLGTIKGFVISMTSSLHLNYTRFIKICCTYVCVFASKQYQIWN